MARAQIVVGTIGCAGVLVATLSATTLASSTGTVDDRAVHALAATPEIVSCARLAHRAALAYARSLSGRTVTLADGTSLVVFEGGCDDGNDNDALTMLAAHRDAAYSVVGKEYGFLEKLGADGSIAVMRNPGGTDVRFHDTERWDGHTFAPMSSRIVWESTGESKPAVVRLAFTPGASSATVRGLVRRMFTDSYAFDARAGQQLSVDVRPLHGAIGRLRIAIDGGATVTEGEALSWHGPLPSGKSSGHYLITVDGASATPSVYSMTVSIR